jgi:cysteinyl-tRNA synthetase
MIYLYNSLTKKKEELQPIKTGKVGMYVCGPTVYDAPHIGNARSNVIYDVLYRNLIHHYGKDNVMYVRNITDVDDKINKAAQDKSITINELTDGVTEIFHDNMNNLNCLEPTIEPRATKHIDEMIRIIEKLIAKNHAYVADNHVYFSINSDPNYGKLASREIDEMISGARIAVDEHKKHAGDFVLWKPKNPGDDVSSVFSSPWGEGRPGWHIECSAMSHKYLGADFDIHGGGADLMFPHHSNEIAQSTCAFENSNFAKMWVHNGFLTVNKEKMSKSLGNFITVNDLLEKGIEGEVIRYLLLSTHYRKPLDFNEELLNIAKKSLQSFHGALEGFDDIPEIDPEEQVIDALNNDLNTPLVLSILHGYCSDINRESDLDKKTKSASLLKSAAKLIGLLDAPQEKSLLDAEIMKLISEREIARKEKNWAKTDEIRDGLKAQGILLEDNKDGSSSWKRV